MGLTAPRLALAAALVAAPLLASSGVAQLVPAIPDSLALDSLARDSLARDTLPRDPVLPRRAGPSMLRALAGISVFHVAPRGDFARHAARGIGYGIAGSFAADGDGILALKAEWNDVYYGRSSNGDTSAFNVIRTLDVGPQLMLPTGPVRPYVSAGVGAAYTGTEGWHPCRRYCDQDDDGYDDQPSEGFSHLSRLTYSLGRAAGVLFRAARATAARPALWVDVRYSVRRNGATRYGLDGMRGGTARGETAYRMVHVGVSTGMR